MLSTKVHLLLTNTFCLRKDLNSRTWVLQGSTFYVESVYWSVIFCKNCKFFFSFPVICSDVVVGWGGSCRCTEHDSGKVSFNTILGPWTCRSLFFGGLWNYCVQSSHISIFRPVMFGAYGSSSHICSLFFVLNFWTSKPLTNILRSARGLKLRIVFTLKK